MVRQKEFEEGMELCMQSMMVSCEMVEGKESVEGGVNRFAEAWRR